MSAPVVPRRALTEREGQILDLVAEGCSNGGIARRLYLSEDTIKTHLSRAYRVLGARDRAHAVHLRHTLGVPSAPPAASVSCGRLLDTVDRWQGRVPRALLDELREIAARGRS